MKMETTIKTRVYDEQNIYTCNQNNFKQLTLKVKIKKPLPQKIPI